MIRSSAQQQGKVVVWAQRARPLALCVLAVLVAASFGLLLGVGPAHAETFTVISKGDAGDNNVGNGSCFTGAFVQVGRGFEAECTLRAAIQEANVNGESDTISFGSWLSGTITLSLGELTIADDTSATKDLIIQGPGARTMTVSGNDASRVFLINSLANVTISRLTITDGNTDEYAAAAHGGGIFNGGTLTLTNSTISGNSSSYTGGGIFNGGTLTLTNSTISGNSSSYDGGGIANFGDTLTVTNSTISGNSSSYSGGGIANSDTLRVSNSTINGNSATYYGGGIYNYRGTMTVWNSTLSGNSADEEGGGIYNYRGTGTLTNTILAGNRAITKPDARGLFTSEGKNLIGNTTGSSGWVTSDLKNVDPLLGPLQDNGGPTLTRALLPGSPAVDAGRNAACPERDQRGVIRKDGDQDGSVVCDIGAFERNDLIAPRVTDTAPNAGQTGVNSAVNLSTTFSEKMDRTTLTKSTFKLYRVNSNRTLTQITAVTVSSTTDGLEATLNPDSRLLANTRYKAVVTTGAKDRAGNRLDQNTTATGNQPMEWTFTTGSS